MNLKPFLLLVFLASSTSIFAQKLKMKKFSAEELLTEVIKYYDPTNKWLIYNGTIHLYTVRPNGTLRSEDIYLDNKKEIYQSFLYQNDSILMKRWEKGQVSYSVNGLSNLSAEARATLRLQEADIQFLKKRHRTEIGWPMSIKSLGIVLNRQLKEVDFNNKICWRIESIGTAPGTEKQYPLLQHSIFYYVNPENFSLEGMDFPLEIERYNIPSLRVIFNGEIEVDGIKIPRVKTYYNLKNKQYLYSTSAHEFAKQTYVDIEKEKELITAVLTAETYYFEKRNFKEWAATWSHKPDVVHCFASSTGFARNEGWENVKNHIANYFKDFPEPQASPTIERSNYVYHIHGNIAWVYFDSKESTSHGRHQRILRKENGQWKLINMTGLDETSYMNN